MYVHIYNTLATYIHTFRAHIQYMCSTYTMCVYLYIYTIITHVYIRTSMYIDIMCMHIIYTPVHRRLSTKHEH